MVKPHILIASRMLLSVSVNFILIVLVNAQDDDRRQAVDRLFNPGNDPLSGFVEVTKKPLESLGASSKCGEGEDVGKQLCVRYFMCDRQTRTIIQDGKTDGFGIIDIRSNVNLCDHYLDVCCKVPEGQGGMKEPPPPTVVTPPLPPVVTPPPAPAPVTEDEFPEPNQPSYCGIRNDNGVDFQITGNNANEAEYGELPWMVAILKKQYNPTVDPPLICGGSLIAPDVVLTGAHCVYAHKTNEIKIRAGEWDTQTMSERLPYQERDVANIVVHPEFNSKTLYNDVALVLLNSPFKKAKHIGTICLPRQGESITSRNCFASGWGKDNFGREGKYQVILKKIELPIVDQNQCQSALRTTRLGDHFVLHPSFTCAGGEPGKDTCLGDGGSPLVCPDPQKPYRYVQAGIVAWGIGCGEAGIPGVYADVSKFRSWIDQEMQRLNHRSDTYS